MNRSLFHKLKLSNIEPPVDAAQTDNTPIVSSILDRAGYESLLIALSTGTLADVDAVFSVKVEHGDDSGLSDASNVAAAELQIDPAFTGTPAALHQAAFTFAADAAALKIGYKADKRYVRVTVTPANNSGAATVVITAILGNPRHSSPGAGDAQVP